MAKGSIKAKQEMRQSYAEYGMKMSGVTIEKFDAMYEVEMLALISARENHLDRLIELSRLYLARDVGFTLTELISVLVALRWSSLKAVESVVRWRTHLVHKEPVRWREKDGTVINYLLKMCRDSERWCLTFNLPYMLGISMGQRNPFMMPLFAGKFAAMARPNKNIRRFLPLQGVIRHDLLLDHVRGAYAYSNSLMGGDVPRLWWTSDEERNIAIHATLSSLADFAIKGTPEMFARIAEANQYLQQEEAAALKKNRKQKPNSNPSSLGKPEKIEEPFPEWGFDAWVKMPYAVGKFPRVPNRGPSVRVEVVREPSHDETAATVALDAAAAEAGRKKHSVDDTSSRPLEVRYDQDLANRAHGGVPTSFETKLKNPPPKPPWWGVGAAPFDSDMFRSAHERSTEERRHAPTVSFEGGEEEEDTNELEGAFPLVPRDPSSVLPPPSASGACISKERRTDVAAALLKAEAQAEESALSLPPLSMNNKDGATRTAKDGGGSTKDPERSSRAARKEAAKLEQAQKLRIAEQLAARRLAARRRFEASLRETVNQNHDEVLRVLTHCETDAAEPLPRRTLLTAGQASVSAVNKAAQEKANTSSAVAEKYGSTAPVALPVNDANKKPRVVSSPPSISGNSSERADVANEDKDLVAAPSCSQAAAAPAASSLRESPSSRRAHSSAGKRSSRRSNRK